MEPLEIIPESKHLDHLQKSWKVVIELEFQIPTPTGLSMLSQKKWNSIRPFETEKYFDRFGVPRAASDFASGLYPLGTVGAN
jgi:hypothetical protein